MLKACGKEGMPICNVLAIIANLIATCVLPLCILLKEYRGIIKWRYRVPWSSPVTLHFVEFLICPFHYKIGRYIQTRQFVYFSASFSVMLNVKTWNNSKKLYLVLKSHLFYWKGKQRSPRAPTPYPARRKGRKTTERRRRRGKRRKPQLIIMLGSVDLEQQDYEVTLLSTITWVKQSEVTALGIPSQSITVFVVRVCQAG